MRSLSVLVLLAVAAAAPAQSPLTTTYLGGNGLPGDSAVYFDVAVAVPITIHQVDVNCFQGLGASAVEFWTAPATWVGKDTNPAAWTLRGSSALVNAQPEGTPAPAPMVTPFVLPAGSLGVAIVYRGTLGPCYTNGNGGNQVYARTELTLQCGASGGIFTGAVNNPRVWNGSLHYTIATPGTIASSATYGAGCVAAPATFYELFPTAASFDLSMGGFTLQPQNGGYAVGPLQAAYLPPSAGAAVLPLGDDGQTSVTLSAPFPYPGGSTSSLVVCSNGFVSMANGNGSGYQPTAAGLLAMAQTVYACWHDYNPTFPGSGQVKTEEAAGRAVVTWDGVFGYSGTGAGTAPSTFQLQFVLATGAVHFVFRGIDPLGGSAYGDAHLVGWSPGSATLDPGGIDLSAAVPGSFTVPGADLRPLALAASARPVAGTTIQLLAGEIPAGTPFGAVLLGLGNPALGLAGIGMPGCTRYTDGLATLLFVAPATSHSLPLQVPVLIGVTLLAQAAVFAPQANLTPLGAIASNGLELRVGDL
ncbi:MAG: hypothetical protein FJ265_00705 [Planctomycetes bacterium]|nr:hypothetical protein [Planctomycetota bacterium]